MWNTLSGRGQWDRKGGKCDKCKISDGFPLKESIKCQILVILRRTISVEVEISHAVLLKIFESLDFTL